MKREDVGKAAALLRELDTMERHAQRLVCGLICVSVGGTALPVDIAGACRAAATSAVEAECSRIINELIELGVSP